MIKKLRNLLMILVGILVLSHGTEVLAYVPMKMGEMYTGEVTDEDDYCWYKIDLKTSGYLSVEFSADDWLYIGIYDDNDKCLTYEMNDYVGSVGCRVNAGVYWVLVEKRNKYARDSEYTISPWFEDTKETFLYENEFISDVRARSAIPFSTLITAQISETENVDYYKMVLPKTGNITIDITNGANTLYTYVCNSNGRQIGSRIYTWDGARESETYNLSKGTYYLKFEKGYTGIYKFKVSYSNDAIASFSAKKASQKSIVVKANKAGAVSGYEIQYRKTSGSWKKIKVAGSKKLNRKIKKLSKGAKYVVRIRTYYNYSGKIIYSDWSRKKWVKLK